MVGDCSKIVQKWPRNGSEIARYRKVFRRTVDGPTEDNEKESDV